MTVIVAGALPYSSGPDLSEPVRSSVCTSQSFYTLTLKYSSNLASSIGFLRQTSLLLRILNSYNDICLKQGHLPTVWYQICMALSVRPSVRDNYRLGTKSEPTIMESSRIFVFVFLF